LPTLWRVTGTNFKPVGESLKSLKSRGNLMQNHFLNLTSSRRTSGDTIWYVSKITIDNKTIKFTKKDLEHMDLFNDIINDENKKISDAYHKAHDKKKTDVITAKVIDDLEDDPATILAS
jgi:cell shape-determining protein MreC